MRNFRTKNIWRTSTKPNIPEEFTPEFEELETLEFISKNENIILIGTSSASKTNLAIELGIAACMAGESVYFATVSNLMIELKEAMSNMQITHFRQKFERYSLVILDELVPYPP
ncbi:MAG: ATP-binding protein [Defluviitaleaceae bacterium]|nr:ATP-binding protein [Defluviitaleaceae bacterium]